MKKVIIYVLLFAGSLAAAYLAYRSQVPDMVAKAVVSDSLPSYIPKRIQSRIQEISTPINEGTQAVILEMQTQGIPTEELMATIDQTSEEDVNRFLDELNSQEPNNIHQVFDIAKKHIQTDFNPEVLRTPFTDHVNMKQVRRMMKYAQDNRKTHDLNFETTKAILKKIILEKEKELNGKQP
jgi:uncharacterized protein (DUF433 family)